MHVFIIWFYYSLPQAQLRASSCVWGLIFDYHIFEFIFFPPSHFFAVEQLPKRNKETIKSKISFFILFF